MAIYRDLALTTRHSIQIMVFLFYESSFLGYDPPEQAVFSNCNLCQEVVYNYVNIISFNVFIYAFSLRQILYLYLLLQCVFD